MNLAFIKPKQTGLSGLEEYNVTRTECWDCLYDEEPETTLALDAQHCFCTTSVSGQTMKEIVSLYHFIFQEYDLMLFLLWCWE